MRPEGALLGPVQTLGPQALGELGLERRRVLARGVDRKQARSPRRPGCRLGLEAQRHAPRLDAGQDGLDLRDAALGQIAEEAEGDVKGVGAHRAQSLIDQFSCLP